MPFQPKRYTAGKDAVSAADLNARAEEIKRLGRISIDGGSVISDGSGIAFSIPRGGANYVLGSITGTGSGANDNAHSWKQHFWLTDGDSMELPNGIVGDATTTPMVNPAYAINGSIVDAGTRIMAWKGLAHVESGLVVVQDWFFVVGGGSSNPSFIAKITSGTNPYAWTEQDCAADGKFTDKASGARTGTIGSGGHNPAWEYNKNTAVAAGTYVRLWPCFSGSGGVSGSQTSGGDTEYVFHHAGGGAITVKEDDGSPTITDVNEIQFEADDFVVTSPAAGQAKVNTKGVTGSSSVITAVSCDSAGLHVTEATWTFTDGLRTT